MSSETTRVAEQCRLREWAAQIRDCQSRPAGMNVAGWYASHGITKANYYYRLRRVREACLETIQGEIPAQPELLQQQEQKESSEQPGLDISTQGFSVHITESTPIPLLVEVLEVIRNA